MRKILTAVVAASAVLALAGIAYAANVYTVDGSSSPRGKGKASKPLPKAFDFDYTVQDQDPNNRGTPVEKYFIGAEGLVTYPEEFPACSGGSDGANNQDLATVKRVCGSGGRKAHFGGGIIKAYAGPSQDQTVKLNCVLELNLYNIKPGNYGVRGKVSKKHGALGIRIDAVQASIPNLNDEHKGKCATAQNEAIIAPYAPTRIKGQKADELRFTVPQSLLHPSGLDTVVQFVESEVRKRTAMKRIAGVNRRVGFYSSVGCGGRQRTLQVTFIDEAGDRTPKTDTGPC
jgi:hypothetical protein